MPSVQAIADARARTSSLLQQHAGLVASIDECHRHISLALHDEYGPHVLAAWQRRQQQGEPPVVPSA